MKCVDALWAVRQRLLHRGSSPNPKGDPEPPISTRGPESPMSDWRTRVDATAASAGSGFKGEYLEGFPYCEAKPAG